MAKSTKEAPELRSIAVLEWTGEAGHPKASRLVPVLVFDAGQLQDGSIYMARPEPLALAGGVEYELQENGQPVGLYDVGSAGQEQGSWVGHGAWKPLPAAKPTRQKPQKVDFENDAQSDQPVLHRKHHADDSSNSGADQTSASNSAPSETSSDPDRPKLHKKDTSDTSTTDSTPAAPSDSDRPVLHKKDNTDSSSGAAAPATGQDSSQPTLHKKDSSDSASDSSASDTASAPDPDRPTLHKKQTDDTASSSASSDDPDRPVLKKSRPKKSEDVASVETIADSTDPDRPRLKRGKVSDEGPIVAPTVMGLPPDLQQAVAVSDRKSHTEHPWSYAWANPEDEEKMKSALEEVARNAMGVTPPPPAPAPKKAATRKSAKPAPAVEPPPLAPLLDEQFRVFELAYGSGATLVLSAHSDGPLDQQKFVTLIAQPDLYGSLQVLLKNVADIPHLDERPRMRLVDAVDALADNRGELLFELRGATQRQFALYRILRGQAEKLFVGGGGDFGGTGQKN